MGRQTPSIASTKVVSFNLMENWPYSREENTPKHVDNICNVFYALTLRIAYYG